MQSNNKYTAKRERSIWREA